MDPATPNQIVSFIRGIADELHPPGRGWPVTGASLRLRADGSMAARGRCGEQADDLVVCELALREKVATGDKPTDPLRARGHSDCTSLAPCINKGIT